MSGYRDKGQKVSVGFLSPISGLPYSVVLRICSVYLVASALHLRAFVKPENELGL